MLFTVGLDRMFRRGGRLLAACSAVAVAFAPTGGSAATPAGTIISNIAHIQYLKDGASRTGQSNRVDVRVDEVVRFSVTPVPACGAPQGMTVIAFRITNNGNAPKTFIPRRPEVIEGTGFVVSGVYADTNGNGCYDPGIDQLIPAGGRTPVVGPGGSTTVFVVGSGGSGPIRLRLLFVPGSQDGGDGTGEGSEGGGWAVTGPDRNGVTGDSSTVMSGTMSAQLVKSQTVRAQDGSATPRSGATVTYTIEGRFTGIGMAADAVIADAIPAGTIYVPGSLKLDGAAVSDTGDGDAGVFDGQRVSIRLGNVVAPAVRTVSFQVRID